MNARLARLGVVTLALPALAACVSAPDDPPAVAACLQGNEPLFARYEAISLPNDCRSDGQCVIGGCSSETCAAEPVTTTCELIPTPQREFTCRRCGCLDGACRWVR